MVKIVTKSPAMKIFVQNVKTLLTQHGWTHQELADAIGVHRPRVGEILTDKHSPTIRTVEAIADAFDVSLSDLFTPMEISEKLAG